MKINKYPDGSSYVTADSGDEYITWRLNSYEDLWILNQFVDVMNNMGIIPTITVPNLIDAQADRRFNEDESSGLKLVCNFLNGMNANFRIFHPHNPEVIEALIDNVEIINNNEFIEGLADKMYELSDDAFNALSPHLILMSSDAGGFKPLMKLCDKLNWKGEVYSASKSRSYKDGKSKLTQIVDRDDFGGKDILIIDDISVYGGTFKGLSKLLKKRNCGKLYLAVSHMTVRELGDNPVTDYFDKVFITNSKFDEYTSSGYEIGFPTESNNNLEIIKLF